MNDWSIQSRSHACTATGRAFSEGEFFYTLLFRDGGDFRREDVSEEAWKGRPADAAAPYSFWRTKYTPPPPVAPEALGRQTAEDLLRRYMEEKSPQHAAARYLLAAMLERKRLLKEIESKHDEDGMLLRIFEHTKTGEVFVVPDPQLRLDQIEQVQAEVAGLLAGPLPAEIAAEAPAEHTQPADETVPSNS